MSDTKKYYVYSHHRKDNGKCFYIGKGTDKRAYTSSGRNKYWNKVKNKAQGFEVVIIKDNLTEEEALELEKNLIKEIGKSNLTNITDGGDNPPSQKGKVGWSKGKKLSDYHKQRISESRKSKNITPWNKGIPQTEEHRENNRKSHIGQKAWNKGISHTEETKKKISLKNKGVPKKPFTEEHKANMRAAWAKRKQKDETEITETKEA